MVEQVAYKRRWLESSTCMIAGIDYARIPRRKIVCRQAAPYFKPHCGGGRRHLIMEKSHAGLKLINRVRAGAGCSTMMITTIMVGTCTCITTMVQLYARVRMRSH